MVNNGTPIADTSDKLKSSTANKKRRSFIKISLLPLVNLGIAGCLSDSNNGEEEVSRYTMGTSSEGSSAFQTGQGFQAVISENLDHIRLSTQVSEGLIANLFQMSSGEFDVITTSSSAWVKAQEGRDEFEGESLSNIGYQGFTYQQIELFMLTRSDSDIDTYSDLDGRTVATYPSGTSPEPIYNSVFNSLDVEIERRDIQLSDYAEALSSGRVEAIGAPTVNDGTVIPGSFQQVHAQNDLKVIRLSDQEIETLENDNSFIYQVGSITFNEGTYPELEGQTEFAITYNPNIVFSESVPETHVYDLTSTLVENVQDFLDSAPGAWDISEEDQFTAGMRSGYPVHPGIKTFMEEKEWMIDE